ncbi:MAG: hypothetical protein KKA79_10505 [Nanoarchaeota archaeon]|nr:hypothetical protein [Nanoarchaeota archaeon]
MKLNKRGYIDPGTGGMVIGSIWPVILAIFGAIVAFFIKWFYKPIKNMIFRFKK